MEGTLTHLQITLEKFGIASGQILDTSAKDAFGKTATSIYKDAIGTKSTPMTFGNVKIGSDIWTNHMTSTIMELGRNAMIENKNRLYLKKMKMRRYPRNEMMKSIPLRHLPKLELYSGMMMKMMDPP